MTIKSAEVKIQEIPSEYLDTVKKLSEVPLVEDEEESNYDRIIAAVGIEVYNKMFPFQQIGVELAIQRKGKVCLLILISFLDFNCILFICKGSLG